MPVSSNCQTAQSVRCSLMVDSTFEAITSHKPKLWHERHGDGCFVHHASPTMRNPCQVKQPADSRPPASVHKPHSDLCRGSDMTTVPSPALTHSLLISPTLPCACLRSPVFPCSPALSLSTAFPHFTDFSCCERSAPLPILGHPVCPLVPTLANAP